MSTRNSPPTLAPWIADAIAPLPALCTLEEVAGAARVSVKTLRRRIAAGSLRAVKTGGGTARVLVARTELARYLGALGSAA